MNSNTYLLTGPVYRRLKTLGFFMSCYWCGEKLLHGDMIVSCRGGGMRVKRLLHKKCFEDRQGAQAPMFVSSKRAVPISGYPKSPSVPYVILKKAFYVQNPHPQVLCELRKRGSCRKLDKNHEFLNSQLLLKHHSVQGLELWECQGCEGLLLRLQRAGEVNG